MSACHKEDNGEFRCVAKRGQLDESMRNGLRYCLNVEQKNQTYLDSLHGKQLSDEGDKIFGEFWENHRAEGATCDFGGMATLVELNKTITDDDAVPDDDEYSPVYIYTGPSMWTIFGTTAAALLVGGLVGFVVAMNVNKDFNKSIRQSLFSGTGSLSRNRLVRSSLALDKFADYDELNDVDTSKLEF